MFRIAAIATVLLLATTVRPMRADDVSPILKTGVWYLDELRGAGGRYEYTFRKDGTFLYDTLVDVAQPRITGKWKVVVKDGKSVLILTSKDGTGVLREESELRYDKAKNVLVFRDKDGKEVTLKFRKR